MQAYTYLEGPTRKDKKGGVTILVNKGAYIHGPIWVPGVRLSCRDWGRVEMKEAVAFTCSILYSICTSI